MRDLAYAAIAVVTLLVVVLLTWRAPRAQGMDSDVTWRCYYDGCSRVRASDVNVMVDRGIVLYQTKAKCDANCNPLPDDRGGDGSILSRAKTEYKMEPNRKPDYRNTQWGCEEGQCRRQPWSLIGDPQWGSQAECQKNCKAD